MEVMIILLMSQMWMMVDYLRPDPAGNAKIYAWALLAAGFAGAIWKLGA